MRLSKLSAGQYERLLALPKVEQIACREVIQSMNVPRRLDPNRLIEMTLALFESEPGLGLRSPGTLRDTPCRR